MVQISFDATTVDPSTGGQDVFETGEYGFHIVSSKLQDTKSSGGKMLVFEAACLDEGQSGKRINIRLNIVNQSAQAQEIAARDLSAISYVTNTLRWTDTQQLHGKPFRLRLEKTTYTKNDGTEAPTNDIKGFLDINGNPPGQGGSGGASPASAAPSAPSAPAAPVAPAVQPVAQPAPVAPAVQPAATAPAPVMNAAPAAVQPEVAPAVAVAAAETVQPAAQQAAAAPQAQPEQPRTVPWEK